MYLKNLSSQIFYWHFYYSIRSFILFDLLTNFIKKSIYIVLTSEKSYQQMSEFNIIE